MRTFLIILFLIIVVVGGVIYWGINNVDTLVEAAIERGGTDAAKADVSVDDVAIEFDAGTASIGALSVSNPAGFSSGKAISIDGMKVVLDTERSNVGDRFVVMKELTVIRPVVNYERGAGTSNIDQLQANIQSFARSQSGSSGGSGSGSSGDAGSGGSEMRFVIDKLTITQGEVTLSISAGELASSDLPAVTRTGLGEPNGLTSSELGRVLITELRGSVTTEIGKGVFNQFLGGALGTGEGITEGLGKGLKGVFD